MKFMEIIMEENKNMIDHPSHYTNGLECIDEMVAVFGVEAVIAHCKWNAWKYRYRAGNKWDKEEDLKKADWYLQKAVELQNNYFDAIKDIGKKLHVVKEQ